VKLPLSLIKRLAVKTRAGMELQLREFLISALDEGEWPGSYPHCFCPQESARNVHWAADRLRHKTKAKGKISAPAENLTLVFQLVSCHYSDLTNRAARLITIVLNFRRPMKNITESCTEVKTRELWKLTVSIHSLISGTTALGSWSLLQFRNIFLYRRGISSS
jgi:hypothetical protein